MNFGMGGMRSQTTPGIGDTLSLDPVSLQKLYPMWQKQSIEAQSQGQPFPQFNEWVKMYKSGNQMMGEAP